MPEKREYDPAIEAEGNINNAYNAANARLGTLENRLDDNMTIRPGIGERDEEHLAMLMEQTPAEITKFFESYDQFPKFAENEMYSAWADDLVKRAETLGIDYERAGGEKELVETE